MELILIAAMTTHRVLGRDNILPWRIQEDMAHFRTATMGHAVIMGRKTWHSVGGPLVGRRTIVLSTTPGFQAHPDCEVYSSLNQALCACTGEAKVFLAGGEQIFREGLALADTILLSVIDLHIAGDVFFPAIPMDQFVLVATRQLALTPSVRLETYRRTAASGSQAHCEPTKG